MKIKIFKLFAILFIAAGTLGCSESSEGDGSNSSIWSSYHRYDTDEFWEGLSESCTAVPLADPFILYYDGYYFAYGTGAQCTTGVEMWVSKDLKGWKQCSNEKNGVFILHKDDSYGDTQFWAPEVYILDDGRFMMYYTAQHRICVAFSDTPEGPFVNDAKEAMYYSNGAAMAGTNTNAFCIDNHLFIDEDNGDKGYLFFVRGKTGTGSSALSIYQAELNDDYTEIVGDPWFLFSSSKTGWEDDGNVNEGPYVYKHNGTYYLTFSSNSYTSQKYAVGYATSTSLDKGATWTKSANNPILCKPQNAFGTTLMGTGHHAFFRDKDGKLRIVFHAHQSSSSILTRRMHYSDVSFDAGGNMSIESEFTTPVVLETSSIVY